MVPSIQMLPSKGQLEDDPSYTDLRRYSYSMLLMQRTCTGWMHDLPAALPLLRLNGHKGAVAPTAQLIAGLVCELGCAADASRPVCGLLARLSTQTLQILQPKMPCAKKALRHGRMLCSLS